MPTPNKLCRRINEGTPRPRYEGWADEADTDEQRKGKGVILLSITLLGLALLVMNQRGGWVREFQLTSISARTHTYTHMHNHTQEKRRQYLHNGQLVYEWDQSLDEVCV